MYWGQQIASSVIGILLIALQRELPEGEGMKNLENANVLTRGESGVIAGVCSGLAAHYGLRKNGLRLAFLLTSFFFIIPTFVYIVLWLVLPKYPSVEAMRRNLRRKAQLRKSVGSE